MTPSANPDDRRRWRNVAVLVFAQAVLGSQLAVHIILGGLAGAELAHERSLATLPISIVVLVSMLTAPAASMLMGRYGRRAGFLLGAAAGGVGGALAVRALFIGSFELLVAAAAFTGVYQSFQGFYRFAAADTAPERLKPKAISWVFAGGLLSALIGPEIVRLTSDAFAPVPFAGAYAAIVVVNVVGATSLLATAHRPAEQAKVQGLNDFLVFGLVAAASFGSGALLDRYGWHAVQLAMIPGLVLSAAALGWLALATLRERATFRPARL